MRIARLDLTRYGRFTDSTLEFPAPAAGAPDLHIVFGRNEAGKSTLLSAWLDLLYGIPTRSDYAFLHPYPTMKIGALLDLGDRQLQVARIKAAQNSLLDAHGAPLPDAVMQAALGGVSRDGYRAMFSLDDDTLKEGGESILASQGDFGQLLFSASAGLAGLTATLDAVRAEAEGFHRPRAQKTALKDLRAALDALDDRLRALDTGAGDHARLTASLDDAEAAHAQADAALAATVAALAAVDRQIAALPTLTRLHAAEADLRALPDLPTPPEGWAEELPALARASTDAAARIEEAQAALDRLDARLATLHPDPQALALGPRLADLAPLKTLRDAALADLPARQDEAEEAARQVAARLHRLNRPQADAAGLLLPADTIARLRHLIATRSGIRAAAEAARSEATAAEHAAIEAADRLASANAIHAPDLAPLLARLRARDPGQALRLARRDEALAEAALSARLAALAPWQGTAETLAPLPLPSRDQLDRLAQQVDAATLALHAARSETARLAQELARQTAAQAEAPARRVTEAHLIALRSAREAAWAALRQTLTPASADAFESALRADDLARAQHAEGAAADQRRAQVEAALAHTRLALDQARAQQTAAETALTDLTTSLAEQLAPGVPTTLPALRDWLALRAMALESDAALNRARSARALAEADLNEAAQALSATLATPLAPYDSLLAQAETRLSAQTEAQSLRDAATTSARMLARRQADLAAAEAALAEWQGTWAETAGATWLGPEAEPTAAEDILSTLDALHRATGTHAALADRVAKMQANVASFATALAALAPGVPTSEATATWDRLSTDATQAQDIAAARATALSERADRAEHLAVLQRDHALTAARIDSMARHFGVGTLADLTDHLTASTRRSVLAVEVANLSAALSETLAQPNTPAALALPPRPALDEQRAALEETRKRQSAQAQESYAHLSDLRRQLAAIGGDDAVARLATDREALLLEIAEGARAHLRLRFGLLVTDAALRSYREGHRSAMLNRASAAFATISEGAYTGLSTQPDKDRERLVALAANGASKQADDLSKGTRYQLYLALRVAGFHEFAANRAPVPFIADDIMETFDDGRTAQSLAILSDMARVGQVIYLTHHAHLCDIARRSCPEARLHQLG